MVTKHKKQPKSSKSKPSTNGPNGHDDRGRYTKGNPGGPGNPFSAQVNKLRSVLIGSVTQKDMRAVVLALVARARDGDVGASKVLLDRIFGPPVSGDLLARIEQLEKTITKE